MTTPDRLVAATKRLNLHVRARMTLEWAFGDARGLPEFIASAIESNTDFRLAEKRRIPITFAPSLEDDFGGTAQHFTYRAVVRYDLALRIVCVETGSIVYEMGNVYDDR